MPEEREYVEVEVLGVGQDVGNRAVVLLRDPNDRQLPIWIGQCEAIAIVQRQNKDFDASRPLTHDLAISIWKRLGATPLQLRIDDLWNGIYYSKLSFEQHGRQVDIDCRPSDGIAMALAADVPIYVANQVFENNENQQ